MPADGGSTPAAEAKACPEGMLANVRAGYADNVTELNVDDFGGPIGFSGLTDGYRASCVFRYPAPDSAAALIVAYFMSESKEFVLEMASRLEGYGFTLDGSNNDLPRDWSLAGLQVHVDRRYADDVSVPNTTFGVDFVMVAFDE